MPEFERNLFQQSSTTYFWSSFFFPVEQRHDIYKLYSFVRLADNYVDDLPAQPEKIFSLRQAVYNQPVAHPDPALLQAADNMKLLIQKYGIELAWVDAFLDAMNSDLQPVAMQTLEQSLAYVYGSAEVIGLMMARLMGNPPESFEAAIMQGRAMQWINFIRDIDEDNQLGRQYLPIDEMESVGLESISKEEAHAKPEAFGHYILQQLARYHDWQAQAQAGYHYLPRRLHIPVATAADMYSWTAKQIEADPLVVFDRKVKPAKSQVLLKGIKHLVLP